MSNYNKLVIPRGTAHTSPLCMFVLSSFDKGKIAKRAEREVAYVAHSSMNVAIWQRARQSMSITMAAVEEPEY